MSAPVWETNQQLRRSPIVTPPLRLPGQSIDERICDLRDKFNELLVLPLCLVALAIVEWLHWLMAAPPNPFIPSVLALIAILYAWRKGAPLVATIKNHRLGRDGERSVGQMLEQLRGKGYCIFHDIIGPDFNIDHVIVGPAGIFTIETKTRSKPMRGCSKIVYDGNTVRIESGQPIDAPLDQARAQAQWVSERLNDGRATPFTVQPIVVFPGWYVERTGPRSNRDVWVLNPKMLAQCLEDERSILSPALVDSAANTLTRYSRWPISQN